MPGLGDDIEHEMTGILSIDRKRDADNKSKKRGWGFYAMVIGGAGMALIIIALIVMALIPPPPEPPAIPQAAPAIYSLKLDVSIYAVPDAHDQRVFKIEHLSGPAISNITALSFGVYGPEESRLPSISAGIDPDLMRKPFETGDTLYLYETMQNRYMVTGNVPQYNQFVDIANGNWKISIVDTPSRYGVATRAVKIVDSKTHFVGSSQSIRSAIDSAQWYDTILVSGPVYKERLTIEIPLRLLSFNSTIIDGGNLNTVIAIKSNNVEIAGFEIENSGNKGFSDGAIVVYQTFSGANIYNNIIHHGAVGIWLWGAKDSIITNNIIYKNDKEGILLQNAADHNMITNNRVDENGGDGIRIDACDWNKVMENNVNGNGGYGIIISDYSTLQNTCEYNTGSDRMLCNDEADRTPTTPMPTPAIHSSLEDDLKNFRVWTDGPGNKYGGSAW